MLLYGARIGLLCLSHARHRQAPWEPLDIHVRAWPWYCDFNLHLNNAHYLTFFEYGRWALSARTGLLRAATKNRWSFLVAGIDMVYRHSIPMMGKATVRTRLAGADDRWTYFEHTIFGSRGASARALVRATARDKDGPVPVNRYLQELGYDPADAPDLTPPPQAAAWLAQTRDVLKGMKAEPQV